MKRIELKEKKIRLLMDDIWDIVYKLNYRITDSRPYIETIRTIIYTKRDDSLPKVKIL